jgi:hypothetical protein
MGSVRKGQFGRNSFGGPALGNELAGQAAPQLAHPRSRCLAEAVREKALHLPKRDRTQGRHRFGLKTGLPRQFFPVLDSRQAPVHEAKRLRGPQAIRDERALCKS